MKNSAQILARVFLGHIFVLAGIGKIGTYAGTAGYMESLGIPGFLLPLVIATEVLGGLAVILGFQTRIAALGLAGFTLLAAVIFHNNLADKMQMILFMKNIAITGGLLMVVVHGAGAFSWDNRNS